MTDASRGPATTITQPNRETPPEPGPLRPFQFPEIQRLTLVNGMPVLAAETEGFPVVTLGLLLQAGGVHEEDRAGLASFTSALLESGAGGRSAADIADALERLGVQLSVATGWDATQVELTGLQSRLRPALEILSDLVRRPTFPEQEVERIRKEHLAGILQRRADPRGLANEMASRFIFSDASPFARPLGGTTRSLEGMVRGDALAFHQARYSPFGATVVVAGDLRGIDLHGVIGDALGDWAGGAPPAVSPVSDPRFEQRELIVVDRPGSVQSEIRVGQVGVPRSTPDFFPLVVMNTVLGGAFTSRLNLNLRERHGFTYGVSSAFNMRREPGPFLVSTAVQTEVTAPALTEILREIEGVRAEPVSQKELTDARTYLAGIFPLRLQTTDGVAARLAELALYDLPPDYFDTYRDRIMAVGRDEVLRVARTYLQPERMAVVIVGDASKVREPLESLGLGPIRVVQPGEVE